MAKRDGTLTADGQTEECAIRGGGQAYVRGANNFGGGTLQIQVYDSDGVWRALFNDQGNAIEYTAPFSDLIELPSGQIIRGTLSGSIAPNLVYTLDSFD